MATTAANYQDLAKEVWDSDAMSKQFYSENPFLDMIEKRQRVVIGKRAQVPVHMDRAGGLTVHDSAGGTINPASSEVVDQAQYTMTYNYFPVEIQTGALNEIHGGAASVGDALEHMMTSGIDNMRNHVTRQFLTGHGRIAQAQAGGAADPSVILAARSATNAGEVSGEDALGLGWIVPGDVVDVGPTSDYNSSGADRIVQSVNETTRTVVLDGANISEAATDFVSLKNVRGSAGTGTLKESAGLVTIAGTNANIVGAIDGNTVTRWNPAEVDTTTTLPDMELLLRLSRKVARKGASEVFLLTSLLQQDNIYSFLQSQVRFNGDREMGAGGSQTVKWRNNTIHAFPQVPENFLFFLSLKELEIVVGRYQKPTWMSDVGGGGKAGHWTPGSTAFSDAVMYALGLAARRRNNMAAATKLTA